MNNKEYSDIPVTDVHPEQPLNDSDTDNLIFNKLNDFEAKLEALNDKFEQRLTYDKDKEKAFELLYSELQTLKDNSALDTVKPIYLDLILLLDRVENIKESLTHENYSSHLDAMKDILESVKEEVLEILLRQEVEVIQTAPETQFDPQMQKAIKTKETFQDSEHNKVDSIVRHGFRYGNRIIRPEEVVVLKKNISKK